MKVYEVPLKFAINHSDIKIKACTKNISQPFVTQFGTKDRLRYQVRVYRTISPLVVFYSKCLFLIIGLVAIAVQ